MGGATKNQSEKTSLIDESLGDLYIFNRINFIFSVWLNLTITEKFQYKKEVRY